MKRRCITESCLSISGSDDPLKSEEDTIPFAEDEYESIGPGNMLGIKFVPFGSQIDYKKLVPNLIRF